MTDKRDIDAIPGERWFPLEDSFAQTMDRYWGDWGVATEVGTLRAALLRRPGREVESFDHHEYRFRAPVDPGKFRREHDELARIYTDNGVQVYYVEEQRADRPNAVFMRDLLFMTPEGAILGRPAVAARRGEERYVAQTLARLGVPLLLTIHGEGTFEGANAMWVDTETVILATGARTNRCGFEQVASVLERLGVKEIIPMQIPYGHAHIDGILNFASEDTVMVHAPQVPFDVCHRLRQKGVKILEAPSQTEAKETMGINFVAVKPGLVVQPAGNPRCREELERNGIEVITVVVEELLKAWGGIHCATAFLKRD